MKNNLDIKPLARLGLLKNEALIYACLVASGPSLISHIANCTGLHRPTIYRTLPALAEKRLISIATRGKQKHYVAEHPEKLFDFLDTLKEGGRAIIKTLTEQYGLQKRKPLVKFLDGGEGMHFVLQDLVQTLRRGDVYYRYSSKKATEAAAKFLPASYRAKRDAKSLQYFIITDALTDHQKTPKLNRAVKIIPKEYGLFDDNIAQLIYGNKVAFADFDSETVVLIENPTIASLQKKIFKILYNLL